MHNFFVNISDELCSFVKELSRNVMTRLRI